MLLFIRFILRTSLLALLVFGSLSSLACGQAVLEKAAESTPAQSGQAKKSKKAKKRANKDSLYMRILRNDDDGPVAMQTSIVTFRRAGGSGDRKQGVTVDLIGAVHVGDKGYYRQLNRAFTKYEAMLYELVAPEHANVPEGGQSQHPVGQMQTGLKSVLQLAYQLEEIDYRKRNFVHADMSPEEFDRVMGEQNESWLTMMLKMTGAAMVTQRASGKSSDADLLFAIIASPKERALRLKRVMSTQFGDLEGIMGVLEGEKGSTIIGMRNKKALDVLERELAKGKKRIGIFYGAGHFPDMEERMLKRFEMKPDPKSIKWLTAWDMND